MHGYSLAIAGLMALHTALIAPAAVAQAINAVNSTVNTTNVTINMNTQTMVAPGGVVLGTVGTHADLDLAQVPYRGQRAPSFWDHNSSIVALEASGNQRRFSYRRPRPGMAEAGAHAGSLLFEGTRVNNSYVGTAYVFAGQCGRYEYAVSGSVLGDRRVVMTGLAPRIDQRTCRVAGYRADKLVFDLL